MPRDELDRYYTPPRLAHEALSRAFATLGRTRRALVRTIIDPHVGAGAWLDAAEGYGDFLRVGFDIDPGAPWLARRDAIGRQASWVAVGEPELAQLCGAREARMIAGNPPFTGLLDHLQWSLNHAPIVLMLVKETAFGTPERSAWFGAHMPRHIYHFAERVAFESPALTKPGSDNGHHVAVLWDEDWRGPTTWSTHRWRS